MKNNDDIFREFQQSLEGIKGHFHVLETSVPVERQVEYFHFSEEVKKSFNEKSIESQIVVLNALNTTPSEKKYAMTYLAISGDVKAYRALEAYSQHIEAEPESVDVEIKDWTKMSLLQAKITLESEFSDEKQVFISTGLGGKGDNLRFYSLFKSNNLVPFSSYQKELIEKEIPFFIREYSGEVEELIISENYFTVVFLISIKVNIKNMLEDALNECNQYGDFISRSFIITNVKKYTDDEIQKELEKN